MEFRILGPLEVATPNGPVSLGGPKQRALLAILLANANEVVSSDRLIDGLWGERPPDTAPKALQVHVSQLRKALGSSFVQTRPPGYVLELGKADLDLHRFRRLRDEARSIAGSDPARTSELLDEALALWRGAPLADFTYEPFAQPEIARLEELRIGALEDRIEADMALGRHAEVIGELEALVGKHPLRERLRAQHMLALYRSRRQAEALEAYQDARRALTDELGIEPGRDLKELQEAVLSQDPALDLRPVTKAAQEERSRGVFVGREAELGVLLGALEDALAGRGRIVLVAGDPGIGKSRLTDELMAEARARQARVLVGRCWEAGGAPAYWPWVQSLRAYVREHDHGALREQLGPGADDLAQLLPELRELFPDIQDPPALEPEGARFRLFEAVSSFLRAATDAGPIVLALDDLHAADEPSLLMLRFVARAIGGNRLLVVAAYRDVDPAIRAPLDLALAELVREPQTVQISLEGLSERQLAEYIELSTGIEPAAGLVRAIHDETEGNPLFATEVVRLLDAEDRIAEADAHPRIPPGLRAVIGQRVGRLSERCRSLLVAASVMGREFGLEPLAHLGGLDRDEVLDVLDEAMAERVVGEVPGSPGRLRFGHALIRDALYEELTPARRLQLHRDAGEALETAYATDLEPHLAELAQHFLDAAPIGTGGKAVEYLRRAGDRASSQLAYEEAVRLYETALPLVDDATTRCDLLLALGDAQAKVGDTPASKTAFREAADLAEDRGLPEHLAQAAFGYGGRLFWEVSRGDEDHLSILERALEAIGPEDSPLRVRLLARLAAGPLRDARFPPERRATLSEEALEMARRLDDPGTLAFALNGYIASHHSPSHTPQQLELATEQLHLAMHVGDKERVVDAHEERLLALLELGDVDATRVELEAMAKLATELRQPSYGWLVALYRALFSLLEGNLGEAEHLISSARSMGERAQSWNAAVTYRLQLYLLRRFQGRLHEIEDLVRSSVEEYPTYRIWRCVQLQMTAALGYEAESREALEALAADGFASLPFDEEWLVGVGRIAEAAAILGEARGMTVLYERLLPYRDRLAVSYPEISTGSVARHLGLLAATMERFDEAEGHFEHALEVNARIGARPWLAYTQQDYARMLVGRNGSGDAERAETLASQARTGFEEIGMPHSPSSSRTPLSPPS